MTRVLRVRPEAEEESDRRELARVTDLAARHPAPVHPVRRFPYVVFVVVDNDVVEVVAIAHGKRKPGYWRQR